MVIFVDGSWLAHSCTATLLPLVRGIIQDPSASWGQLGLEKLPKYIAGRLIRMIGMYAWRIRLEYDHLMLMSISTPTSMQMVVLWILYVPLQ